MSTKDELLEIANTICTRQFLVPASPSRREVWWGNTQDLSPGIGILAHLDRPINQFGFRAITAHLITYEDDGEMSVAVAEGSDPSLLEDDPFSIRIKHIFKHHIGRDALGLSGITLRMRNTDLTPKEYVFSQSHAGIGT